MSLPDIRATLDGLFLGVVTHHWDGRAASAIGKQAVTATQEINELGFVADQQADLSVHGGTDKAIHHYATDHYPAWISEGEIPSGTVPAAFGENIASTGMTEKNLCIGDILRLGSATVQISQGRQPCWKLSAFTGNEKMAYLFQKTLRTGWYYRDFDGGIACQGDSITLIERCHPEWSVERVTGARLTRQVSQQDAETLAELPALASGWRRAFARMAQGETAENTDARLTGQP